MNVTIHLPPEIEEDLVAQARAQGVDLSQFLESLLRELLPVYSSRTLSPAERAEAWRVSTRGLPDTPPLSDEAISRERLYGNPM